MIEVSRGDRIESRHLVDVAVVDRGGRVIDSWGDPDRPVLARSALKPVQAQAYAERADATATGARRLAIACGSHGGQPGHVALVTDWLSGLGLDAGVLECGVHLPYHAASARALTAEGRSPDARHNDCSGKHVGFLEVCAGAALDHQGYIAADHPLQRDHITPVIEHWCATSTAGQTPGVDGCGIPVWSVALRDLAGAWARLAADPLGRRTFDAMTAEPWFVAGDGRLDTDLMVAGGGRVATKTGAEGVYCAVDLVEGVAVALKAHDGATRAAESAICAVLAHNGAPVAADPSILRNWAGDEVGRVIASI